MKSFIIERPETHHVIIDDTHFTVEHPLDCDMTECPIFPRLQGAWQAKPVENGRYEVSFLGDFPMLADEKPYRRYKVKPLRK